MSDKIYIKLTHNQDKQAGDNRPSFVAPINPKSPEGKTWRIGVKIGENWYNQAVFDGERTTLIMPVGLPCSSMSSNPAWLYQFSPILTPILQVLPSGDFGLMGATKLGLLSPGCLSWLCVSFIYILSVSYTHLTLPTNREV